LEAALHQVLHVERVGALVIEPPEQDQTVFFQARGLYWRLPESSDLWYKPRNWKKAICRKALAPGN